MSVQYHYVLIFASENIEALLISNTDNVRQKASAIKKGKVPDRVKTYKFNKLLYVERFKNRQQAVQRKGVISRVPTEKKIELIVKNNPTMRDLS